MELRLSSRMWGLMLLTAFVLPALSILADEYPSTKAKYIPDIGTFMKIGYARSPGIGVETGELFFVSSMSGVAQLYRITEDGWPYQLTLFDDGISWYKLSYSGEKAIIGAAVGGTEDYQLFLMDTRTGRITQITDKPDIRYGSVFWKRDGSGFFFRANMENPRDHKIYYHDLLTGEDTKLLDMEGSNAIADISVDEKYMITYHAYSNVSIDLYLIELESGKYEMITSGKKDIMYDSPSMMPDNKTIYLVCNDNDDGILKRAKLDLETGKLVFLEPDSKWTADEIRFSPDRKYMSWLVNQDGYSIMKLWDMERNQPAPGPPVRGLVQTPVLTDDGRVLFQFNSPTKSPDIWLWDWRKPELCKITHSIYAGIDPNIFIEPTLIEYESFDGLKIPAFLYLPPDYHGGPVPFVIHAHGGPESQVRPYFQRHFQYLLLNGYGIIAPNVRGSVGYGKEFHTLDNYTNRLNSIRDYKAAVDYLIENNYTRKGMIGLKGTSYGGYVVLALITEYPDLFSAAVDHVGIANYVTFLQNTREYRRHIREAEYGPLTDEPFLKSISPIHKASSIKTPLLVVHGENDPRVPVGEARQIIEAVQKSGGIVDSLIFPDEGHGISKLTNRLAFYRKMVKFFNQCLKDE